MKSTKNIKKNIVFFMLFILLFFCLFFLLQKPIIGSLYYIKGSKLLFKPNHHHNNSYKDFYCLARADNKFLNNEINEAIQYLNISTDIFPNLTWINFNLGRAYCMQGDYLSAIKEFDIYIKDNEKNPLGYVEKGFAQNNICDLSELNCNPDNYLSTWLLGGIKGTDFSYRGEEEYYNDNYDLALYFFSLSEKMGSNLYSTIVFTKYQSKKQKESQQDTSVLIDAINKNDGWASNKIKMFAWIEWGKYLLSNEEYLEAENALILAVNLSKNYINLTPTTAEIYRLLGNAYINQDEIYIAKSYFEKSIETYKNNAWAHIDYGKLLYEIDNKNIELALKEFDYAISIRNSDFDLLENVIDYWFYKEKPDYVIKYCLITLKRNFLVEEFPKCKQ